MAAPARPPAGRGGGRVRLNSNDGNAVAVGALRSRGHVIVAAALSARLDKALLEMVLYAAGLATVWASSLRGDPLYGFDIATEYHGLQQR